MRQPKSKEEMRTLLRTQGWKLVWQDSFLMPPTSAEIWEKSGEPYQIRLGWPLKGDCNGDTTTEIEIEKAMHMMGIEAEERGGNR